MDNQEITYVDALLVEKGKGSIIKIPNNQEAGKEFMRKFTGAEVTLSEHIFGGNWEYAVSWNPHSKERSSLEISMDIIGYPQILRGKVIITEEESVGREMLYVDINIKRVQKHFNSGLMFPVLKRSEI